MTDIVSREEFAMLSRQVEDNARRLDNIDTTGTRGVAVLAVQITELAKDFSRHEEKHDRADAARLTARRWLWGAVIAGIAAIDGPIVTVLLAVRGGR